MKRFRILSLDGGGIKGAFTASVVSGRLHRIDFVAPRGQFSLDDARPEKIEQLISLGRGEAVKKEHREIVTARFFNDTPAGPFKPVHAI